MGKLLDEAGIEVIIAIVEIDVSIRVLTEAMADDEVIETRVPGRVGKIDDISEDDWDCGAAVVDE